MKKWLARWLLKLGGWEMGGAPPLDHHFVLIAAPHTSNWDLLYMLAFAAVYDIKISWLAKHSLFHPPMGWVLRAMGGIPIVRHKNSNVVDAMVEEFAARTSLVLTVPTEGTRAKVDYWKSGFYHIAVGAGVPIVPSFLDYGNKRGGFGPPLLPTGDVAEDMQYFRDFYEGKSGKFPELFGPVRLREESKQNR